MLTIPDDLESLTLQQLRELQGSAVQDTEQSQGCDHMTAFNRTKLLYPKLWQELQRRFDDAAAQGVQPILSNEDRARIVQFTPSRENYDRLGLNPQSTDDEFAAATKGAGTDLSNPDFEKAFEAVSMLAMRTRNINGQAADSAVAIRHPNLKKKADMQKAARDIGSDYPKANAGFQKITQPDTPLARPLDGSTNFPNLTRTGLNAFQVKGVAPIANADDADLQNEYLKAFDTPASRAAAINSLAKYLSHEGNVSEANAKKSIPSKVPHMKAVYEQHMKDCQN